METPTERPDLSYSHEELMEWPREDLAHLNAVRLGATSIVTVARFLERTYEAAATHAGWDRSALETDFTRT